MHNKNHSAYYCLTNGGRNKIIPRCIRRLLWCLSQCLILSMEKEMKKKKKKILDAFNRFLGEESSPLLHPRCSPRNVARRWSGPPPPPLAAPICSSWPADLGPASSLPPDLVVPPLAAVEEREAITHRLSSSCCPVVCCTSWPPCICSSSELKKEAFLLARSWPGRVVKLDLSVSAQPG